MMMVDCCFGGSDSACGVAWCGVVWRGVVWCGVVWCGVVGVYVAACGARGAAQTNEQEMKLILQQALRQQAGRLKATQF